MGRWTPGGDRHSLHLSLLLLTYYPTNYKGPSGSRALLSRHDTLPPLSSPPLCVSINRLNPWGGAAWGMSYRLSAVCTCHHYKPAGKHGLYEFVKCFGNFDKASAPWDVGCQGDI